MKLIIMEESLRIDLDDDEKLVLYAVGALDNSPLESKIKIQKLMFLISNVFKDFQGLLHFEPHLFGPYSETLVNVLDSLIRLGLVEEVHGSSYRLNDAGMRMYLSLKPKPELVRVIEDFKGFLNDLSNNEILAFIYVSYPQYISESIKWDELKLNRQKFAISLFKKSKVSFGKAAEIAGLSSIDFDKILKDRRIRWRE